MLRKDELFVMKALAESFNGSWCASKNERPDAFLILANSIVAVEISGLYQRAIEPSKSRLKEDMVPLRICDRLNTDVDVLDLLPPNYYLVISLSAPIDRKRRFYNLFKKELIRIIGSATFRPETVKIDENLVKLSFYKGQRTSGKKIVGIVSNKNAHANIYLNARDTLYERVCEKSKQYADIEYRPFWLALYNTYFLAGPTTYYQAMQDYPLLHPFDRIYLVDEDRKVHCLF